MQAERDELNSTTAGFELRFRRVGNMPAASQLVAVLLFSCSAHAHLPEQQTTRDPYRCLNASKPQRR